MPVTTGTFATANGARYLQQLCKHFAHKLEVSYSDTAGEIQFDMGTAHCTADEAGLTVRFELKNDDAFGAAQHVIDSHLARFAFRENFEAMDWDVTPPPERRSLKQRAKDTLRSKAPGLHASLRDAKKKIR